MPTVQTSYVSVPSLAGGRGRAGGGVEAAAAVDGRGNVGGHVHRRLVAAALPPV